MGQAVWGSPCSLSRHSAPFWQSSARVRRVFGLRSAVAVDRGCGLYPGSRGRASPLLASPGHPGPVRRHMPGSSGAARDESGRSITRSPLGASTGSTERSSRAEILEPGPWCYGTQRPGRRPRTSSGTWRRSLNSTGRPWSSGATTGRPSSPRRSRRSASAGESFLCGTPREPRATMGPWSRGSVGSPSAGRLPRSQGAAPGRAGEPLRIQSI